jgi:hypothetical protein
VLLPNQIAKENSTPCRRDAPRLRQAQISACHPAGYRVSAMCRKAALLLGACVISLVLAEIGVRLTPDVVIGFHYRDGAFRRPAEFELRLAKNRLGFHDVEHGEKQPGVRRILLLGDSFVEAISVAAHETVGQRLEYELNANDSNRYEVVSLGKGGAAQPKQLRTLRQLGPQLEPDLVITLFLTANDVSGNSAALGRLRNQETRRYLRAVPAVLRAEDAVGLVFEHSALNRLVAYRLSRARAGRLYRGIPVDFLVLRQSYDATWEKAWDNTEGFLLQTRETAESLGARYAIVSAATSYGTQGEAGLRELIRAFPGMQDMAWDLDKPDRRLAELAVAHTVPLLKLEPLFRKRARGAAHRFHWRYDGHWNVEGHRLAGTLIADFVRRLDASLEHDSKGNR